MPCGVYAIRNQVNGKTYVGQAFDIYQRWRQHRHRLRTGSHDNAHLLASWRKHGEASFVFEVLVECSPQDLGEREIEQLDKVPPHLRYNLGAAGYSPTLGVTRSRVSRLRQSRSRGGRPVLAVNVETGEERRYDIVSDVGAPRGVIHSAIAAGRLYNGWRYSYVGEKSPKPKQTRAAKRDRVIVGTCLATGETRKYPRTAAVVADGFQRPCVTRCLSGELSQHKGWVWAYDDGLPHRNLTTEQREKLVGRRARGGSRRVEGTHVETGDVIVFDYVAQAAKALGVPPSRIHTACREKTVLCERRWEKKEAP